MLDFIQTQHCPQPRLINYKHSLANPLKALVCYRTIVDRLWDQGVNPAVAWRDVQNPQMVLVLCSFWGEGSSSGTPGPSIRSVSTHLSGEPLSSLSSGSPAGPSTAWYSSWGFVHLHRLWTVNNLRAGNVACSFPDAQNWYP